MCHGHPRYHSCAHTSLIWYYCPSAHIDLETGFETPCRNVSFAPAQSSSLSCPLKNCQFVDKGGSWICCKCNQGPNTQGWCSTPVTPVQDDLDSLGLGDEGQRTCDHGCCDDCKRFGFGIREHGCFFVIVQQLIRLPVQEAEVIQEESQVKISELRKARPRRLSGVQKIPGELGGHGISNL
ncbi:hypothetical protein Trco_007925 [Trichoderma cornu-damae]|uniref:Uncharacterized protein n=1 Tax=Trichoderma cornu-damae TaxID=654480 RepID=A0A9P8QHY3_9HYPO|nr:hypothetical protein Trco_007925 [Trichoderma cornu-damae]